MQKLSFGLIVTAVILSVSGVSASPPGQDLQWETPLGAVTFSGKAHGEAGKQCTDCHDMTGGAGGLFQMKHGEVKRTMAEMNEGKGCGACHNGETAFSTSEPTACMKCHQAK